MIRTTIIPKSNIYNVALDIPNEYLGKEIEIIAFEKKQEGINESKQKIKLSDLWGSISNETADALHKHVEDSPNEWAAKPSVKKPSDFFGILTKEEGEKFDKHIQQMRNEWDRNI